MSTNILNGTTELKLKGCSFIDVNACKWKVQGCLTDNLGTWNMSSMKTRS